MRVYVRLCVYLCMNVSTYLRASVSAGWFGVRSGRAPLGGSPAPGAEISIFCGFRRPGHVKYSALGLPGLEKTSLLKPQNIVNYSALLFPKQKKHCKLRGLVSENLVFVRFGYILEARSTAKPRDVYVFCSKLNILEDKF